MDDRPRILDTLLTLVVLTAVTVQTFAVINEATDGELERQLRYWWMTNGKPAVQRFREWVSSAEITERMVSEEIVPFLEREAS
jgi:hypothetical protein